MSTIKFTLCVVILCITSFFTPLIYESYKNSQTEKVYDDFSPYLEAKNARLIIFTLSTCPICKGIKKLLDENKVAYFEVDVKNDENHPYMNIYKRFDTKKVPVIVTSKYGQIGYSRGILSTLQKNNKG